MFFSGVVKLLSGDPTWRNLTAMSYHYETQPLPTPLAWYMHQLPLVAQKASTAFTFFAELLVPLLFFAPRPVRRIAAVDHDRAAIADPDHRQLHVLQLADDRLCMWLFIEPQPDAIEPLRQRRARGVHRSGQRSALPGALRDSHAARRRRGPARRRAAPHRELVRTVRRDDDGASRDHRRRLERRRRPGRRTSSGTKSGDVHRAPPIVAPHQPRLDWQMWFAALGTYQSNRWFVNFMVRLLQGEPSVLRLLKYNPFPNAPPKYIRARRLPISLHALGLARLVDPGRTRTYFPAVSLK